ncbi:hypothetical protein HIM_08184 [Hirsutella minnesotensis 3608]|uniref:THUMP domain-containing protein n=1 Tax=Hirsutella minnesotensis 3608 TaxID=1043627 RepID=A0A0F7ZHC1_9HYPO|nr:hypothetical protein HIM_08184 [Hirsutella minnesotensis 3608]
MDKGGQKRRQGSNGDGHAPKRSKGGCAGRWKTPHQKAKMAEKVEIGNALEVGDEGIWVTHARGMKTKALREFLQLCDEYGEKLYDIKPPGTDEAPDVDEAQADKSIEASIEDELNSMREQPKRKPREHFKPVSTGLECLFFLKTKKPVKPDEMVRRICEDARDCPDPRQRKCKYIDRLTPVFDTDKATDKGIVRVARRVLAPWFSLRPETEDQDGAREAVEPRDDQPTSPCTYAIRQNVRSHKLFKSREVIDKIAGLVDTKHKVNLGNPDKVILVEVFQLFCGISVVDAKQWEELKRYNVNALYGLPQTDVSDKSRAVTLQVENPEANVASS